MNAFPLSPIVIERLGWVLVHSLWQIALIALLTGVTMRLLQRNPAALRYFVLGVAMIAIVVAPAVTWWFHPVAAPEKPSRQAVLNFEHESTPASSRADAGSLFDDQPMLATEFTDGGREIEVVPSNVPTEIVPAISPAVLSEIELAWWERATLSLRPWLAWIVAGWSFGVVLCSLRPLLGWHTLRRLGRVGVSPVSDDVAATLHRVSERLGVRRAVRVLHSTLARAPIVVGYFTPVILLPVSLVTTIPTAQLEAILAHELAHVRRHDFLVNLLQTLVETLFFYHPAVWWLSSRLRAEREHCCDDLVVATLGNRVEYGRALLAIEELRGCGTVLAVGAADGSLLARVRRIVGLHSDLEYKSLWPALSLIACCFGAVLVTSVLGWSGQADSGNDQPSRQTERVPASVTEADDSANVSRDEPAWGEVTNGLRARVVPVLSSTSAAAVDPTQRVENFEKAEDVAFVVELENVTDKPIKLVDVWHDAKNGEPIPNSDWLSQFVFSVELFDRDGKVIEQPKIEIDDVIFFLHEARVATLQPGKRQHFLIRPVRWLAALQPQIQAGSYRVAVRYCWLSTQDAARTIRKQSSLLEAAAVDVVSAVAAIEVGGETRKADLVWGEAINGLRAAVSFAPSKATHMHGEKLEVRLHLKNVGTKPLKLISDLSLPDASVTIRNDAGESVDLDDSLVGGRLTTGMRGLVTLASQQVVVLDVGQLGLAITEERASQFDAMTLRKLIAPAGEYSVQLAVSFRNVLNARSVEGQENTLVKDAWVGALQTSARPLTITNEMIKCDVVDTVTGELIADTTTSFHFIKPKTADAEETTIAVMVCGPQGSGHIYFEIPDKVMQRADREELEVRWGTGNHPDYENYSPDERIPLKPFFHEGPKAAREILSTIKLTPKKKLEDSTVESGPPDAGSDTVAFPAERVKFELQAVAFARVDSSNGPQRKIGGWWRPDGTKLEAAPSGLTPISVAEERYRKNFRELVFRVNVDPELARQISGDGVGVQPWNTRRFHAERWNEDGSMQFQLVKSFWDESPSQLTLYFSALPLVKAGVIDLDGRLKANSRADVRTKLLLQSIHVAGIEKSVTETIVKLKPRPHSEHVQVVVQAADRKGRINQAISSTDGERHVIKLPASEIDTIEIRLRPMTHAISFQGIAMLPGQTTEMKTQVKQLDFCVDIKYALDGRTLGMFSDVPLAKLEEMLRMLQHDLNTETGSLVIRTNNRATFAATQQLLAKLTKGGWKWPRLSIRVRTVECDIVDAVSGKPVNGTTVNFRFVKPGKPADRPEEIVADIFWGPNAPSRIYFAIPDEVMARPDREEVEVEWGVGQHDDYEPFIPQERLKLKPFLTGDPNPLIEALTTIKLTPK